MEFSPKSFGLGNYLGYDHPVGQPGFIPDGNFYNLYPNRNGVVQQ